MEAGDVFWWSLQGAGDRRRSLCECVNVVMCDRVATSTELHMAHNCFLFLSKESLHLNLTTEAFRWSKNSVHSSGGTVCALVWTVNSPTWWFSWYIVSLWWLLCWRKWCWRGDLVMLVRACCCYKALVYFLTYSFMCCRDENIISAVVGSVGRSPQWRSR